MSKNGKRNRLKESALKRAKANLDIDPGDKNCVMPAGSVAADHVELRHNNTYGPLPNFYKDELVVCKDCGTEEVWTARAQKWWYEEKKADINTRAIYCRQCRKKKAKIKQQAREIHLNGIERKKSKNT